MSQTTEGTWKAKLICDNCDHDWQEPVPKRHIIEGSALFDYKGGQPNFSRFLLCPNCGNHEKTKKYSKSRT